MRKVWIWVAMGCLLAGCARGPEVEVVDFGDAPSATPAAPGTPRTVGLVVTGTPTLIATPTAMPRPPVKPGKRVSPRFGPPGGTTPAETSSVRLAIQATAFAEDSAPPAGSDTPSVLPLTTREVFVAAAAPSMLQQGMCKAQWFSPDPKDSVTSDSEGLEPNKKVVQFSLLQPAAGWKSGLYRVEIRCEGKSLGTAQLSFEDRGDTTPLEGKPPGKVLLSNDEEAEHPGEEFPTSSRSIYLHLEMGKLKKGSPLKVTWVAADIPRIDPGKVLLDTDGVCPGGGDNLMFDFKAPAGKPFLAGRYRVELRVSDKLVYRQTFLLKEGA